jgi:hypothetical protein
MDPLVGIAVLGVFGLMVGAVGFFFIYLERRQLRKQRAAQDAAHTEAHA